MNFENTDSDPSISLDWQGTSSHFTASLKANAAAISPISTDKSVSLICSAADKKKVWAGILQSEKYPSLIAAALGNRSQMDAKNPPTFFCQALKICQWIASNPFQWQTADSSLSSIEKELAVKVFRQVEPNPSGQILADRLTNGAQMILERLGVKQRPSYFPPHENMKSEMALLRLYGKSRSQVLDSLRERIGDYKEISGKTRTYVINLLRDLAEVGAGTQQTEIVLVNDLMSFDSEECYTVVERCLQYRYSSDIDAEVASALHLERNRMDGVFATQEDEKSR